MISYFFTLILPILIFCLIKPKSKYSTFLNIVIIGIYTYIIYTESNWLGSGSYYFRYLTIIILMISFLKPILKFKRLNTSPNKKLVIAKIILLVILGMYMYQIHKPRLYPVATINLDFPLKNGTYIVTQGGKSAHLNYHVKLRYKEQQAIDISKINSFGSPLNDFFSEGKRNEDFLIFADSVFSPCDGKIEMVENTMRDHPPFATIDGRNYSTNKIQIKYNDFEIVLAHFKEKSIVVSEGDSINKGDFLGLVGNTGLSSAPHLHIHASQNGLAAYMKFDDKYLVKNNAVKN